jgi:hypothetical protein
MTPWHRNTVCGEMTSGPSFSGRPTHFPAQSTETVRSIGLMPTLLELSGWRFGSCADRAVPLLTGDRNDTGPDPL